MSPRPDRRSQLGFTLVELLVVVAVIGIIASIAIPHLQRSLLKARVGRMAKSANTLYHAMLTYNVDHSQYPSSDEFDRRTLEPLVGEGYLRMANAVVDNLYQQEITSYASPDVDTEDSQFWAVLTLDSYTAVQIVVADTDEFPGFDGTTIAGAYFVHGNELLHLDEDILKVLGK